VTERVAIVGPPDDPQVRAVGAALEQIGVEFDVVHMHLDDVSRWRWTPDDIMTPAGVRLSDAAGVYVRSMPVRVPGDGSEWVRPASEQRLLDDVGRNQRRHGFLKSVHLALSERGVDVVNPLWGYAYHRSKPAADLALAAAGLAVPRGIATSDAAMVAAFMDEVGPVVYKPVAGGGRCRVLDPDDLTRRASALNSAPSYFQELVAGSNLRVYTIGDEVVAVFDIESDQIDYRGFETGVSVVTPWPELCDVSIRAARALGLTFAGTDVKCRGRTDLTVLDVNPSPMFAALDARVDGTIASSIARRLTNGTR
jgi:glutathione synthase/RimK-type ligase-like ATP-grasp enzyme